jgi:hypothetical protein
MAPSEPDEAQSLQSATDLFERLMIKIAFVRAYLISFHVNNGRCFKRQFLSRGSPAYSGDYCKIRIAGTPHSSEALVTFFLFNLQIPIWLILITNDMRITVTNPGLAPVFDQGMVRGG